LPVIGSTGEFVAEADTQAGAQHRLGLEGVAQLRDRELVRVEELRVWPETYRRTGVALADGTDDFELRSHLAVVEADRVLLAAAAHPTLELLRQRVDDRHTHTVQSTGESVTAAVEFAARMQAGEDQLDAADLFLGMDIDGHASPVIANLERAVLENSDVDLLRVAAEGLIDAVVDDFVREMIRPGCVGVHARAAPNRLQPGENLD
jgi:hypothetical protein